MSQKEKSPTCSKTCFIHQLGPIMTAAQNILQCRIPIAQCCHGKRSDVWYSELRTGLITARWKDIPARSGITTKMGTDTAHSLTAVSAILRKAESKKNVPRGAYSRTKKNNFSRIQQPYSPAATVYKS